MKRFQWSLQRVLDVTIQREDTVRSELADLADQIERTEERICERKNLLRSLLEDMGRQDLPERIPNQHVFMEFSVACERQIRRLQEQKQKLETLRAERMQAFMELRAKRQTLEKLREEAWDRYRREFQRQEQKSLDDAVNTTYSRKIITGRN